MAGFSTGLLNYDSFMVQWLKECCSLFNDNKMHTRMFNKDFVIEFYNNHPYLRNVNSGDYRLK